MRGVLQFALLIPFLFSCAAKKVKPGEYSPIPIENQFRVFESLPQVKMVQFADSFSLTREIPALEKEWISILYLERGFDVLAMRGSAFDLWLAMDSVLTQSVEADAIRQARLLGMPMGYQTREMEALFSWVRESKKREEPFYVAGFGNEVGASYGWRNQFLFRVFAQALRSYGVKAKSQEIESGLEPLLGLKKCRETGFPKSPADHDQIKRALISLKQWIQEAEPGVVSRFPDQIHARVLKSLTQHFEWAYELCSLKMDSDKKNELDAKALITIQSTLSKSGKVIVLGELDQLRHSPKTLGGRLKSILKDSLYTIGTFPLSGEWMVRTDPPRKTSIKGDETPFQMTFRDLKEPSFVALNALSPKAKRWGVLFQKSPILVEGIGLPMEVFREMDALLLVPGAKGAEKWYLDHLQFKKEW